MIRLGKDREFKFDMVFPPTTTQAELYNQAVAPLIEGIFDGYNATIFAYGQTSSGKSFTMGTEVNSLMDGELQAERAGVIPRVIDELFARIENSSDTHEHLLRVSFIEIYGEEVRDLLHPDTAAVRGGAQPPPPVHIREAEDGAVVLAGVKEHIVTCQDELAEVLAVGALAKSTGATKMNAASNRSHCIVTLTLERRAVELLPDASGEGSADTPFTIAKLHLVDLAGSERAKRTEAVGQRLQESIGINKGLLALGNVIAALATAAASESSAGAAAHIPYRDSKLTRVLQDSLGGSARTLMLACVSPADINAAETLNTLRYAERARAIRNSPKPNATGPAAQLLPQYRSELERLQLHLLKRAIVRNPAGESVAIGSLLGPDFTLEQLVQDQHYRAQLDHIQSLLVGASMQGGDAAAGVRASVRGPLVRRSLLGAGRAEPEAAFEERVLRERLSDLHAETEGLRRLLEAADAERERWMGFVALLQERGRLDGPSREYLESLMAEVSADAEALQAASRSEAASRGASKSAVMHSVDELLAELGDEVAPAEVLQHRAARLNAQIDALRRELLDVKAAMAGLADENGAAFVPEAVFEFAPAAATARRPATSDGVVRGDRGGSAGSGASNSRMSPAMLEYAQRRMAARASVALSQTGSTPGLLDGTLEDASSRGAMAAAAAATASANAEIAALRSTVAALQARNAELQSGSAGAARTVDSALAAAEAAALARLVTPEPTAAMVAAMARGKGPFAGVMSAPVLGVSPVVGGGAPMPGPAGTAVSGLGAMDDSSALALWARSPSAVPLDRDLSVTASATVAAPAPAPVHAAVSAPPASAATADAFELSMSVADTGADLSLMDPASITASAFNSTFLHPPSAGAEQQQELVQRLKAQNVKLSRQLHLAAATAHAHERELKAASVATERERAHSAELEAELTQLRRVARVKGGAVPSRALPRRGAKAGDDDGAAAALDVTADIDAAMDAVAARRRQQQRGAGAGSRRRRRSGAARGAATSDERVDDQDSFDDDAPSASAVRPPPVQQSQPQALAVVLSTMAALGAQLEAIDAQRRAGEPFTAEMAAERSRVVATRSALQAQLSRAADAAVAAPPDAAPLDAEPLDVAAAEAVLETLNIALAKPSLSEAAATAAADTATVALSAIVTVAADGQALIALLTARLAARVAMQAAMQRDATEAAEAVAELEAQVEAARETIVHVQAEAAGQLAEVDAQLAGRADELAARERDVFYYRAQSKEFKAKLRALADAAEAYTAERRTLLERAATAERALHASQAQLTVLQQQHQQQQQHVRAPLQPALGHRQPAAVKPAAPRLVVPPPRWPHALASPSASPVPSSLSYSGGGGAASLSESQLLDSIDIELGSPRADPWTRSSEFR